MKKIKAIIALIAVCSLVSCGTVETAESSVTIDLPKVTEAEQSEETTAAEPEETTTKNEKAEKTTSADEDSEAETTTTAEDGEEAPTEAEQPTEAPAEETPTEATEPPTEAPTEAPAPQEVSFSMDLLNADASGILSALGTPIDVQFAPSCLSNGADQEIHTYSGLVIYCYVLNGSKYIYQIEFTNENHATSKGIRIGSSKADVEAAYGYAEEMGGYMVFHDDSQTKELDIRIVDDAVQSIIFYTAV